MISSRVINELGLERIGLVKMRGLGGEAWKRAFLFHVAFPDGLVQLDDPVADQGTLVERFQVSNKVIEGGEPSESGSFDVLIGMDVITTGDRTVRRGGTFTFDY